MQARRSHIHHLEIGGDTLVAHDDKTMALTAYYTDILGHTVAPSWGFDLQRLYCDAEKAHAEPLIAPFMEAKAKQAVRSMNAASAPGPDGLGPSFYTAT